MFLILVPAMLAASMLVSVAELDGDVMTYYLLLAGAFDLYLWTRGTRFTLLWIPFWLILLSLGTITLFWSPPNSWPGGVAGRAYMLREKYKEKGRPAFTRAALSQNQALSA